MTLRLIAAHQQTTTSRDLLTNRRNYTVSQKIATFKLSVYLCQILTDFQTFCAAGKRMKFYRKPIRQFLPALSMSLHYLAKLKVNFFADVV